MNIRLKLNGSELQSLLLLSESFRNIILNDLKFTNDFFELEILEKISMKLKGVLQGLPRKIYSISLDGRLLYSMVEIYVKRNQVLGEYEQALLGRILSQIDLEASSRIHHRRCLDGASRGGGVRMIEG